MITIHTIQNFSLNQNSSIIIENYLLQKIFLGFLLFSLSIFTVFGNILVLYAIRTEKRLRTVSNLFILSLAFADLVVGLIVMPLSATNIIAGRWIFSSLVCQIWLSIDYVASTASIFNLVLLSLDRYWAVVYPLLYLQTRSRKRANHFIFTIWFISLLWVPAIVFWSYFIPEYSDLIKPTECDTSFRSNKLFKTLTALINFYFPLLTMIIISCRIMIAIRSRSTMEFGRRISTTTQKQMKQERTFTNTSLIRHGIDNIERKHTIENDGQSTSISIVINPFESIIDNQNIKIEEHIDLSNQKNDDNNNFCKYKIPKRKKSFCLTQLKPIQILFPSLTTIKENEKRKSECLIRKYSNDIIIRNSESVSNNMKYSDNELYTNKPKLRTISTQSSLSDECSHIIYNNSIEPQISLPTEKLSTPSKTSPSPPTHTEHRTLTISNDNSLTPINSPKKMNILTFFDYIIDPSRSRSLQKELKAARQLGLLVGIFTVTWLPYFIIFLVVAWCQQCVSDTIYISFVWLG